MALDKHRALLSPILRLSDQQTPHFNLNSHNQMISTAQWIFIISNWSLLYINTSAWCFWEAFDSIWQPRSLLVRVHNVKPIMQEQFSTRVLTERILSEICQMSRFSWHSCISISLFGDKEVPQMSDPGQMAVHHLRPCCCLHTSQIFHNPFLFLFAHSCNGSFSSYKML
jgi:hypothetical protein